MPLIQINEPTVPVTVAARIAVLPRDVYDVIVPIDLSRVFRAWGPFPGVTGSHNQTGPWDAVGASRNPQLSDGSTADERLTELSPPHSFAYELTDFTGSLRLLVRGVRGEWTFTPDGDGTLIRWTYEFAPLRGRLTVFRAAVAPLWARYARKMLRRAVDAVLEDTGMAAGSPPSTH